mmetsp:Transcript_2950/g.4511  ORF Transcript_2950/g.4511 Transcript_2950/m.4511 type:complete len:287 (+) Transcript_2950:587-1447(+)
MLSGFADDGHLSRTGTCTSPPLSPSTLTLTSTPTGPPPPPSISGRTSPIPFLEPLITSLITSCSISSCFEVWDFFFRRLFSSIRVCTRANSSSLESLSFFTLASNSCMYTFFLFRDFTAARRFCSRRRCFFSSKFPPLPLLLPLPLPLPLLLPFPLLRPLPVLMEETPLLDDALAELSLRVLAPFGSTLDLDPSALLKLTRADLLRVEATVGRLGMVEDGLAVVTGVAVGIISARGAPTRPKFDSWGLLQLRNVLKSASILTGVVPAGMATLTHGDHPTQTLWVRS